MRAIEPFVAVVKPRVFSAQGGSDLPLDDIIASFARAKGCGTIEIVGGPGAGKTTALQHLCAVLAERQWLLLVDDLNSETIVSTAGKQVVVFTSQSSRAGQAEVSYQLAPWSNDDLIEYLLVKHPKRCRSVMARLKDDDDMQFVEGTPELWRIVLDRMASDDDVSDVRTALRKECAERLTDALIAGLAREFAFARVVAPQDEDDSPLEILVEAGCSNEGTRMLRHRPVQLLLAADYVVSMIESSESAFCLDRCLPRDLVAEVAGLVRTSEGLLTQLEKIVRFPARLGWERCQSMAASILHSATSGWRPEDGSAPHLSRAYLMQADWRHVRIHGATLVGTDLSGANLRGAELDGSFLIGADFSGARLSEASLQKVRASAARFLDADLRAVVSSDAFFDDADFTRADLRGARLVGANFRRADLTEARLCDARLSRAMLVGADIRGADFSGADLDGASLARLSLRDASFAGASFVGASLADCNLESMELPDANFESAVLTQALLTASIMPNANFRRACLLGAGLADVEWEGVDLRGANLSGCSFHMGSSRSGLVDSPYASEGTRTGFYSDDYEEQHFKAPEEIRKANLCGADLRRAQVEDADFYLVDLRGALYDRRQLEHFRRCGAILFDRS